MNTGETPIDAVHEAHQRQADSAETSPIDVVRLAEKVYALMRAELRLEKARGAARMEAR